VYYNFFILREFPLVAISFFKSKRGRLLGKRDPQRCGFGLIGSGAAAIESQKSEPT
jgi:hypothetical protein